MAPGTANVFAGHSVAGACKTLGCNLTNSILALILIPPGLTIAPSLKIFLPNRSRSFWIIVWDWVSSLACRARRGLKRILLNPSLSEKSSL